MTTRTLVDHGTFYEGPRWHEGRLWFSDFYEYAVKSISLAGDMHTEFTIDDRPSGLGWMPDGSLLVVSMTMRHVLRRTVAGKITTHADLSGIATFHCNDMVVDSRGRAYAGNFVAPAQVANPLHFLMAVQAGGTFAMGGLLVQENVFEDGFE